MAGTLYLIPAPLADDVPAEHVLPADGLALVRPLQHFVVEHPKTARQFLKRIGTDTPLQSLSLQTLNEHTTAKDLPALLQPLQDGKDVGLLSEAGCPAVADPGAQLVALAHRHGIRVMPLVGPSSLLLALMGSGLNGQRFSFQGYLPADRDARAKTLRELEVRSRREQETILFIETPYRNGAMWETLLGTLHADTRLAIGMDLTGPSQTLACQRVSEWKKTAAPEFAKRPTVFLFLA